jgi:hypothetical protein
VIPESPVRFQQKRPVAYVDSLVHRKLFIVTSRRIVKMDTYIIVLDCKLDSTGAGEGLMTDFANVLMYITIP